MMSSMITNREEISAGDRSGLSIQRLPRATEGERKLVGANQISQVKPSIR